MRAGLLRPDPLRRPTLTEDKSESPYPSDSPRASMVVSRMTFLGGQRDEFLNMEQFDTVLETRVLADRFKKHYNTARPQSSLDYRPPAPEAFAPWPPSTQVPAAHTGLTL